jgi:acetyl-CoA synthetase (ADP-forming)
MSRREAEKIIKGVLNTGRKTLLETESKALFSAWGIPIPQSTLIKRQEDIAVMVNNLTPPFVLKVVSPDILHKSEAGGVVTGIKDVEGVNKAWAGMMGNFKEKVPQAKIEGFLLEEMAPTGVEVIIGGLRDPQFGPAVMFGVGGIMVELMKDVSFRLAPLDKKEAYEMMKDVKGYPLLTGFRGSMPVDRENLVSIIIKFSDILLEMDEIKELEINPLLVYEKGVMAVDARVLLNSDKKT